LVQRCHRREIEATVAKVEKIEIALEPHFQQLFAHAMAMPNKDDAFPEMAKEVTLPEQTAPTPCADRSGGRRGGTQR
jgi:uncharacterized 2Fe-2S/4Fe-4S cluster protein (DUF4445 family)